MGNCNSMDDDTEEKMCFKIHTDEMAIEDDEQPEALSRRMKTLDKNVFIGVEYSPSPSPYIPFTLTRCPTSSRLPGTQSRLSTSSILPRSKSERVRKNVKRAAETKRSSLPSGLMNGSMPNMVVIAHFREMYFSEMANSTPNFFTIQTDTARSRPMDTPVKFNPSGYSWAMCLSPTTQESRLLETQVHKCCTFNLASDGSDSQFAFNVPVLSPIFSNKVATFAAKDQEIQDSIVNEINLQDFEESEFFDNASSEDSLAQLVDLLEARSSSSNCGTVHTSSFSPSIGGGRLPSLGKIRVSTSRSLGGFTLPPTPLASSKRFPNSRSPSPVAKLKTVAADLGSADLEEFQKELEELARKYRMKKRSSAK